MITKFPPVDYADTNGLLCIGGDLSYESLTLAYSQGIFPWPISADLPMQWFTPDPRGVLFYKDLKINRTLKKVIQKGEMKIEFNKSFINIIQNCAENPHRPAGPLNWINKNMIGAYTELFNRGKAFCVGAYLKGKLVGGLYGVVMGQYLTGESMFYLKSNASKLSLIYLMEYLHTIDIDWIDIQMVTPLLQNMGGREIPRQLFLAQQGEAVTKPRPSFLL